MGRRCSVILVGWRLLTCLFPERVTLPHLGLTLLSLLQECFPTLRLYLQVGLQLQWWGGNDPAPAPAPAPHLAMPPSRAARGPS